MTYHPQPPADEMEWLKHQLWERDFRINSLEARLQDKNITIARMEERLDHARKDAEGALRTVMLVCSASERMLWTPPDSVNDEKRLKQMERDVQHSPFIVKEEKYRRLGEVQNVAETSTSTTPLTPDSTPLDDKISFNDKESRRPTVSSINGSLTPSNAEISKAKSEGSSSSEQKRAKPTFIDYFPAETTELPTAVQKQQNLPAHLPATEIAENGPFEHQPLILNSEQSETKFIGVFVDKDTAEESSPSPSPEGEYTRSPAPKDPRAGGYCSNGRLSPHHGGLEKREYLPYPPFDMSRLAYRPVAGAVDVYRTVIVDNLPRDTKLKDILTYGKEHPIVSSQHLDTSGMRLRGQSEPLGTVAFRIEFFFQSSAEQFAFDLANAALIIRGLKPRVTHLASSPTYPLSPVVKSNPERGPVRTRRIRINQPCSKLVHPQFFPDALEGDSYGFRGKEWIVDLKSVPGRKLVVEFNSVRTAVYAFYRLRDAEVFVGCDPEYVRDYGADEPEAGGKAGDAKVGQEKEMDRMGCSGVCDSASSAGKEEPAAQENEQNGDEQTAANGEGTSNAHEARTSPPPTQRFDTGLLSSRYATPPPHTQRFCHDHGAAPTPSRYFCTDGSLQTCASEAAMPEAG